MPNRTREGKFIIFNVKTGEQIERWPVDAMEMVRKYPETYTHDKPASAPALPDGTVTKPIEPPGTIISKEILEGKPVPMGSPPPREHSPGVPLKVDTGFGSPPAAPVIATKSEGSARSVAGTK